MNIKRRIALAAMLMLVAAVFAEPETKQQSLDRLRSVYAEKPFRAYKLKTPKTLPECLNLLEEDGIFSDLREEEAAIRAERMDQSDYSGPQKRVSELNREAFDRLWVISETFRKQETNTPGRIALRAKVFRGFIHYAALEDGRLNGAGGRFHECCFAIPLANVNSYFCFFGDMQRVENGTETDPLMVQVNHAFKTMGMQAWTQPYRNDETDANVVSVERFQNHVWWVGGNALAYRPVLQAACMMNSIPMVDVMAEVAKKAVSPVSQTTYDEAFWTEGFTADGAGWGHGMQCLIWGYPVHGGKAALGILKILQGTPWAQQLDRSNIGILMNFIQGSSWYYHDGFIPPCLGRENMMYDGLEAEEIPSLELAEEMLSDWQDSLTAEERAELEQFVAEAKKLRVRMAGQPNGHYTGSRYFYNNDDLIVKSDDYYFFINMASVRCDGIESAHTMAAKYNFYTCDGQTLFMRRGDEAKRALGGFNLTAFPGVTARQGGDRLNPVTNWRGYCSKHNFAAGATRGGTNACAGMIFEKMNASAKKGVNDTTGLDEHNEVLYGVRAYKSWFIFGDTLLALGAGITNLEPGQEGDVWTTIDQTLWNSPVASSDWMVEHDGRSHHKKLESKRAIPWVKQRDGFTYAILPEYTSGSVSLVAERRASIWDALAIPNAKIKDKPETTDILQVSINHGRQVLDDTYAYVVYAGKEHPGKVFAQSPVAVLSNTTNLQAAASLDGKVVEAVFFNPDTPLKAGEHTFRVSAPCAFMAEFEEDRIHISVTDAEMNVELNKLVVELDGREIMVPLPHEPHRGQATNLTVAVGETTAGTDGAAVREASKPNVLMIAIDDLNDWVGFMGGHPDTKTPNMDRFAAQGTVFMNAHTAAPHCGPSRTALMSGLRPSTTGVYGHIVDQNLAKTPAGQGVYLSNWFENNGYKTMGRGKLFHLSAPEGAFQEMVGREQPEFGPKPEKRFKWDVKGTGTDWGVFPERDEEMPDFQTAQWAVERLQQKHDQPFFLAVGFVLPHVPWYAPQKWFDLHPIDSIGMPPYLPGDQDDLPEIARRVAEMPQMPTAEWAQESGEWKYMIQAYLATISMVDYCVGMVLDELGRSGYAENTVVVLWSDHGYHLGEKNRFAKQSLWERSTRMPLVFAAPGFKGGQSTDGPASLMDVYPTLLELCGLPPNPANEGVSLVPLMRDPAGEWKHTALTTYGENNHAVRSQRYRYIRYEDGSEELYDGQADPDEWKNIASNPECLEVKEELKKSLPQLNAAWSPYTYLRHNDYFTGKSPAESK